MAVTFQDIARAANLNKSTVSRAMRNDPRVAVETRERVQELARELGYNPNPLITALMENRRGVGHIRGAMIACVSDAPGARVPGVRPWLDELYQVIKDRAAHLGFTCEVFFLEDYGWQAEKLLNVLHARGFAGLIWNCSIDHPMVESPRLKEFAVVINGLPSRHFSTVNFDDFANAQLATERALALGFERPGVMLWDNHPGFAIDRCEGGYHVAVRGLPAASHIPLLKCGKAGHFAWAKRYRPDIVIGNVWPLPEFPYIALDWIRQVHGQDASCSGINVCRNRLGIVTVDLVASHLYHNERGMGDHARHIYVPGEWLAHPETPKQSGSKPAAPRLRPTAKSKG